MGNMKFNFFNFRHQNLPIILPDKLINLWKECWHSIFFIYFKHFYMLGNWHWRFPLKLVGSYLFKPSISPTVVSMWIFKFLFFIAEWTNNIQAFIENFYLQYIFLNCLKVSINLENSFRIFAFKSTRCVFNHAVGILTHCVLNSKEK